MSKQEEREKGAFVYKGAGARSKMDGSAPPEQRLCDQEHVAMQRCLAARNHQEKWCKEQIKAWKQCFDETRAHHRTEHEKAQPRTWLDPSKYDKQGRPLR
jgi:hypothetical protein